MRSSAFLARTATVQTWHDECVDHLFFPQLHLRVLVGLLQFSQAVLEFVQLWQRCVQVLLHHRHCAEILKDLKCYFHQNETSIGRGITRILPWELQGSFTFSISAFSRSFKCCCSSSTCLGKKKIHSAHVREAFGAVDVAKRIKRGILYVSVTCGAERSGSVAITHLCHSGCLYLPKARSWPVPVDGGASLQGFLHKKHRIINAILPGQETRNMVESSRYLLRRSGLWVLSADTEPSAFSLLPLRRPHQRCKCLSRLLPVFFPAPSNCCFGDWCLSQEQSPLLRFHTRPYRTNVGIWTPTCWWGWGAEMWEECGVVFEAGKVCFEIFSEVVGA